MRKGVTSKYRLLKDQSKTQQKLPYPFLSGPTESVHKVLPTPPHCVARMKANSFVLSVEIIHTR